MQIDDLLAKLDNTQAEIDRVREEKDAEIAVLQEGMDQSLQQLADAQQVWSILHCTRLFGVLIPSQNQGIVEETTNAQIDTLILDNRKKLNAIIGPYLSQ